MSDLEELFISVLEVAIKIVACTAGLALIGAMSYLAVILSIG